jgi:hypothetical protein
MVMDTDTLTDIPNTIDIMQIDITLEGTTKIITMVENTTEIDTTKTTDTPTDTIITIEDIMVTDITNIDM